MTIQFPLAGEPGIVEALRAAKPGDRVELQSTSSSIRWFGEVLRTSPVAVEIEPESASHWPTPLLIRRESAASVGGNYVVTRVL